MPVRPCRPPPRRVCADAYCVLPNADYGETVTVFCVRDFFAAKKLSQGILNDQTRSQRVNGTYLGKQRRKLKGIKSPGLKAAILDVLGKRKRPDAEDTVARAAPAVVATTN